MIERGWVLHRAILVVFSAGFLLSTGSALAEDSEARRIPIVRVEPPNQSSGIRALVLVEGENNPTLLGEIKQLGMNTIVTCGGPSLETARAALAAGLSYVAYMSSNGVARLLQEPEYLAQVASAVSVSSFRGFYYQDETILQEGYTSPVVQRETYNTLKALFPTKLVLFPLRLDLIKIDPAFLDQYFRPEFTDLVTPYFYPVGTTSLGTFQYVDDWESVLSDLLTELRQRMPAAKSVLPVLQAIEQPGYPVEQEFAERQMDVYRLLWPPNGNFAGFDWGLPFSSDNPFLSLDQLPKLQIGFRALKGGNLRTVTGDRPTFRPISQ